MNPFLPEAYQSDLILASKSPRRIDILRQLGFEFKIEPAGVAEQENGLDRDPYELPGILAGLKAARIAKKYPQATVIGADTVVIVDNRVLNKPRSDAEAAEFIRLLSGRTHTVVTGLAVLREGGSKTVSDRADSMVRFRSLTDLEIQGYVSSGEGRDKAGAYGIQGLGAGLVQSVEGCYFNVVGLPVALLLYLLNKIFR